VSNQASTQIYQNDYRHQRNKEAARVLIDLIRRIKFTSGIGARFYNKTFSNFKGNDLAVEICKKWASNYQENVKNGQGLFFTGGVGTGKTHLIAAIIDYIARIKKRLYLNRIIYRNATSLLNEIRSSYNSDSFEKVLDKFKIAHLLIIDDLGAEKTTDWVLDIFFEIIDCRYAELRPTIIATNLTDIEIKQKLDERIMSRIYEMCKGIKLTGRDYRLEEK
jgi:DNA replication protein DnaC